MKRLAILIGGLLVLPAFAEVAPVYYEDIEYSDVAYDEYGNPIYYPYDSDLMTETDQDATKPSVQTSRNTSATRTSANRTTIGRNLPTSAANAASGRASAANSSRAVAARTTTNSSPRSTSNARSVASRTTSSAATRTSTDSANRAAATRATGGAGRSTASSTRGVSGGSSVARTTTTRATASGRNATSSRTATTGARVNRASTNAAVAVNGTPISAAPIRGISVTGTSSTQTLTDSGNSLYIPKRAGVSVASSRVGMNNRVPTIRMASTGGLTTTDMTVTAADLAEMDELAELTDYCKAQYAACMDNYCNVLDDNQGRCSCSANLKKYATAEAALKKATEELQEVAQQIQYIGLSAREVETLFTQTEAELKMQTTTDTSQLKTSLDKIRDMIIEVQSGNASSTSNSSFLSFDLSGLLDFTIDSTGFDLSSFLGGFGTNSNTINNQRGEELFKTATNRCKANVLRACTNQGVDASLITNAYDLEIDKECIIYERSLNDSNDQMIATVRNAKSVLQKARLLVEQSKNEYDMRGCINALDSCMQDEYVCGTDYEKCLDPSGRYIVNGEIVIGTDPGRAVNGVPTNPSAVGVLDGDICTMNLYNVWNYSGSTAGQTTANCTNAWNSWSHASGNGNLSEYINNTLGSHDGLGMSQYIQAKIGWKGTGKDSDKNYGMCMSVLNKCQDYTYTGTGSSRKYNEKNEVVKQYLERMLVQIKAKQDEILAEHAESCITDVQTCLSQNGYPFDEEGNTGGTSVAANIAINACRSTIVTCMSVNGYSVDNPTPTELSSWVCGITTGSTDCVPNSDGEEPTPTPGNDYVTINVYGNGGTIRLNGVAQNPLKMYYYPATGKYKLELSSSTTYNAGSVIDGLSASRDLHKLRGVVKATAAPSVVNSNTTSVLSSMLFDKELKLKTLSGYSAGTMINVYAAWARECESSNYCSLAIGSNGTVTYNTNGSCPTGSEYTQIGTYRVTCTGTTQPQWVTFSLMDEDNGSCASVSTPSNPQTIYYQSAAGAQCATGFYSSKNCTGTSSTINSINKPVCSDSQYTYQGHFSGSTKFIDENGVIQEFGRGMGDETIPLKARWSNGEDGGGDTVFSNHNKELTFTNENL